MSVTNTVAPAPADIAPRDLIVTLYGLYARSEDNWLPVSGLIRLMQELGVDGQSVRSSVSRLKRRDILHGLRHGGVAGYELSSSTLDALAEGDVRIFDRRRARLEDGWLLLVFSIPENERDKRHTLRTSLSSLGFGTVSPGTWIAPSQLADETLSMLRRKGLADYVELFRADHLGVKELRTRVPRWWDLDAVAAAYADFIRRHRPLVDATITDPTEAFVAYVPMLTAWRRLPYLDPGLPLEVLPRGWNGEVAEQMFADLNARLGGPAREFAMDVLHAGAVGRR
ncbi:MAG: PaaX family transcriptional regulator [Williamsia herbipolensis]|uniref:Transcriptional regulator, PaaX family n=1 Tax=Williamsia serinedens TaxID=391736 RepID=A0ABT1GXS5_9NOCA|nr:PaaX family transcriptional regulator C-terminal domain-containing protein [Williamsia serinedens]MBE7161087.1 PaaX family transcriptional regulator [Williamsia herbipolensis]MCP2159750.1 transcriptional regulator, PaaX family [Williamsia serinedens]